MMCWASRTGTRRNLDALGRHGWGLLISRAGVWRVEAWTCPETGERIRARREIMRLTQTDVGNVLGISFQQIQKYEQGKNRISAANLQRVADLLGVPVADFYDPPGPVREPPPLSSAQAKKLADQYFEVYLNARVREAAALQVAA